MTFIVLVVDHLLGCRRDRGLGRVDVVDLMATKATIVSLPSALPCWCHDRAVDATSPSAAATRR